MSINQITVMGNLGDDPRMTIFDDGNKVVKLKIATNSYWKDKRTGEKKEETEWHTTYLRNRLAEVAQEYLKKGDKVYISGKMRCRKYVNEKEETHWITEIHGKKMLMISTGRSRNNQRDYAEQSDSTSNSSYEPIIDQASLSDNTVTSNNELVEEQSTDDIKAYDNSALIEKEAVSDSNDQPTAEASAPAVDEKPEIENISDANGSTDEDNVDSPTVVSNEKIASTEDVLIDDLDIEVDCSEDITDEFNRKALEASEQDDRAEISDLPSWLIP